MKNEKNKIYLITRPLEISENNESETCLYKMKSSRKPYSTDRTPGKCENVAYELYKSIKSGKSINEINTDNLNLLISFLKGYCRNRAKESDYNEAEFASLLLQDAKKCVKDRDESGFKSYHTSRSVVSSRKIKYVFYCAISLILCN